LGRDDRLAFGDFYRANYSRIVAQLMLLTRSRPEAEDAAQEAFARALGRWPAVARYDDPAAWVRRVAYNLAVSRWRSARRFTALRHRLADLEVRSGPDDDWMDLRDQLLKLPVKQRQAIVLTAVSGMTPDEVARECGVAVGTVRSWLHRARLTVRQSGASVDETGATEGDCCAPS
jgi:RNA polymerase sigma-70 factor, ECF subfamily